MRCGFHRRGSMYGIHRSSMLVCENRQYQTKQELNRFVSIVDQRRETWKDLLLAEDAPPQAGVLDESAAAIGVRPPCQPDGGAAEGTRGPPLPRPISIVWPVTGSLTTRSSLGIDTSLFLEWSSTRACTSPASLTIPTRPLKGPFRTMTVFPIILSRPKLFGGPIILPGAPRLIRAGFILVRSGPVDRPPLADTVTTLVVRTTVIPEFSA